MKNDFLYFFIALITGALIPIQAATNAGFSKSIGNPFITGLMVFIMGLAAMILFVVVSRVAFPSIAQLSAAPKSGYLGGLIIATYVIIITFLVPRIGVGSAIGLIVTGQILCSVTIDHFGLFNVLTRPLDAARVGGIALMCVGVY